MLYWVHISLPLCTGLLRARIHGDVNVERPAFLSANSTVDVQVALLKIAGDRSNGSLQAELAFPLHARYPVIQFSSTYLWCCDAFTC